MVSFLTAFSTPSTEPETLQAVPSHGCGLSKCLVLEMVGRERQVGCSPEG